MRLENSRSLLASSLNVVIVNATVYYIYTGILPQYSHLGFVSFFVVWCRRISLHHGHFSCVPNQLDETLGRNDSLLGKVVANAGDAGIWRRRVEENHRNALIPDVVDCRHMAYCVN